MENKAHSILHNYIGYYNNAPSAIAKLMSDLSPIANYLPERRETEIKETEIREMEKTETEKTETKSE